MKSYTIISPDGVEYKDVRIIARFEAEHNLILGALNRICSGMYKQYKGWVAIENA